MSEFSADGKVCVPMVVYPYQRIPEKIARNINSKWGVRRSDNKENSIKLPVILFLDGHKSHVSYHLNLLCNELQIEVISIYLNATRILQLCDVSIFRPMKGAWRKTVREWEEEHPEEVVHKAVFAKILEKTINISTKPETVVNEFKVCGLYPFSPDAIYYSKCLGETEIQNLDTAIERQINLKINNETFGAIVSPKKIKIFKILLKEQEKVIFLMKICIYCTIIRVSSKMIRSKLQTQIHMTLNQYIKLVFCKT
nr:unnamed protein product [Callosobruchus analis]